MIPRASAILIGVVLAFLASAPNFAVAKGDAGAPGSESWLKGKYRSCVVKFAEVRNAKILSRRNHVRAIEKKISEYFPNYAVVKKNESGIHVNYSEEELKEFYKAVDDFFAYYHWKSSEMMELRQHFMRRKGSDGKPYPPHGVLEIQDWVEKGYTFEQMMLSYKNRYLLGGNGELMSPEAINKTVQGGAKAAGAKSLRALQKAGTGLWSVLTVNWKATLGGAFAALVGGGAVTAAIEFIPDKWRLTPKDIKETIRTRVQDRDRLHAARDRFLNRIQENLKASYTNEKNPPASRFEVKTIDDWRKFDDGVLQDLSEMAREFLILKDPPLPRPTSLKGVSGDFIGTLEESMVEFRQLLGAFEQAQVKMAVFRRQHPAESRSPADEENHENLQKGLRNYQSAIEAYTASLARTLAFWHLNNTLFRALYAGEQQAPQHATKKPDEPFKPAPEFEIFKRERDKIDKKIEEFRELRIFDAFTVAQDELLKGYAEDIKKSVK